MVRSLTNAAAMASRNRPVEVMALVDRDRILPGPTLGMNDTHGEAGLHLWSVGHSCPSLAHVWGFGCGGLRISGGDERICIPHP